MNLNCTRLSIIALLVLTPSAYAAEGTLSAVTGIDYSSGDYGDVTDTDVWSIPLSIRYRTGAWTFRLSTAWLRVTSPAGVTPEGDIIGPSRKRATEEGMGDVSLSTLYNLLDDRDYWAGLDIAARVKLPTADEDKFLGTGELDYGVNVETYKNINDWSPYINIGYTWRGDPKDFNYKNVWQSTVGLDYYFTRDLTVGANYFWQQNTTKFAENQQEASVSVSYLINRSYKLNLYALTGYSDASPNWGSGLTLIHYF